MFAAEPQQQEPLHMTESKYLEFEENSETKHEYVNGRVYAMAGADWNHVMITQSTSSALYTQLRGKGCKVGTNDLHLKVKSKKVSYRYPDIMVICGKPNFIDNRKIIDNPTIIVEVLSPSTALEDRNAKLDEYRLLESVQEYILVSVDEPKVEVFSRHKAEKWFYTSVKGLDSSLELASISCSLALADVYEQVTFEQNNDDGG